MFKKNSPKPSRIKMEERADNAPNIIITYPALLKMRQIVQTCSAEVGWLGSVTKKDNNYIIDDVYLLKQSVTGATTELDEEDMNSMLRNILIKEGEEKYNSIRVWGHSHVNMQVFASGQDDDTFKEYYTLW